MTLGFLRKSTSLKLAVVFSFATIVSACGGGSSDSEPPVVPPPTGTTPSPVTTKQGVFMGGEVSGLGYKTATHEGVTDSNGQFEYEPNETISFFIGSMKIGETITAEEAISPIDLVPGVNVPVTKKEVDLFNSTSVFNYREQLPINQGDSINLQHQLKNILIVLYSLDKDKNADNGIEISNQTFEAFQDSDFDLSYDRFFVYYAKEFRIKRFEAYRAEGMENARFVNSFKAMDNFAEYLGVTPEIYGVTSIKKDYNGDGIINIESSYSYDESHLINRAETKDGIDFLTFDSYGTLISKAVDHHKDGVVDTSNAYTKNKHGFTIKITTDHHNDGVIDSESSSAYDENGNLLTNSTSSGYKAFYSYDERGNLIRLEKDRNGDGAIDSISTYEYDQHNNQTRHFWDSRADGQGIVHINLYDENRNRIEVGQGYQIDGVYTAQSLSKMTYDENNNQIKSESINVMDGSVSSITHFIYDENNRLLNTDVENTNTGATTRIFEASYDNQGRKLSSSTDYDRDGVFADIESFSYDNNGNLIHYTKDANNDGAAELIINAIFDEAGNKIEQTVDSDGDGSLNQKDTYSYDENGSLLTHNLDLSADGTINEIINYQYQLINFLGLNTYNVSK